VLFGNNGGDNICEGDGEHIVFGDGNTNGVTMMEAADNGGSEN
jgi:hypothetical protein